MTIQIPLPSGAALTARDRIASCLATNGAELRAITTTLGRDDLSRLVSDLGRAAQVGAPASVLGAALPHLVDELLHVPQRRIETMPGARDFDAKSRWQLGRLSDLIAISLPRQR